MSEIPKLETSAAVHRAEGEVRKPRLMGRLEAGASEIVAVVEGFGEAEQVDEPGYAENDGRYEIAPSPPDVEGY